MLNNSFAKTSRGVKLNDAVKTGDVDKRPHQVEREKNQGYSANQYSTYRNFNKNVRYSSFSDKISFDNRQRDEYKMARGSYTRKPTRIVTKRDYDVSSNSRRKFQDSSKGRFFPFVLVGIRWIPIEFRVFADFGGSEDTRISKTLRRMVREDDPDTFSSLCIQLQVLNFWKSRLLSCYRIIYSIYHRLHCFRSRLSSLKTKDTSGKRWNSFASRY